MPRAKSLVSQLTPFNVSNGDIEVQILSPLEINVLGKKNCAQRSIDARIKSSPCLAAHHFFFLHPHTKTFIFLITPVII